MALPNPSPLINALAVGGVGAVTDGGIVQYDFGTSDRRPKQFRMWGQSTNGSGGTPTAPGAAVTIKANIYWSDVDIVASGGALANVPTCLADNKVASAAKTLQNNSTRTFAAGISIWEFIAPSVPKARFMYVSYDIGTLPANALIDLLIDVTALPN